MLKFLNLFVLLTVFAFCEARELFRTWTFPQLLKSSDVVCVAVPVRTELLEEKSELPHIFSQNHDGETKPVLGRGIDTTFEVLAVLKGDATLNCFVLHHYTVTPLPVDGPLLVSFDPSKEARFLMFLKKDEDGRYIPVSGQTDPLFSVKRLEEGIDGDRLTYRCSGPADSAGR